MPATREQIVDEFERQVLRFGYIKTSVEDVAAELGISKRTIYQHFDSKRALYSEVVDRVGEQERARMTALVADVEGSRAKMETFLTAVASGMRMHIQRTSKAEWMQEFEVARDAMAAAYGSVAVVLMEEGISEGVFGEYDPMLMDQMIGAIMTHYGVMVREDPKLDRDQEVVEAIMRMLGAESGSAAASEARDKGTKASGESKRHMRE